MLQIDLKPTLNTGVGEQKLKRVNSAMVGSRPASAKSRGPGGAANAQGLNSYNSLNRANRIRSLAKIIDENKVLLDKLQKTKSSYNNDKWRNDYIKSV
jgi:hypothetical protein